MSSIVVIEKNKNPGCLIQILWFALVGVWLGEIWIAVALVSDGYHHRHSNCCKDAKQTAPRSSPWREERSKFW
jgi:hypothetical protein